MKPYYEHAGITIYHGDCRDVLPALPPVDLVLTDPPYGISADEAQASAAKQRIAANGKTKAGRGWKYHGESEWDRRRPEASAFRLILDAGENAIVWGGNYFADLLPPSMGWLVWDKGQKDFSCADFEMAWSSYQAAARRIHYPRALALQDGRVHPTQKPLEVIRWALTWADERGRTNQTVLDPFMGSGTTLRAAKDLGRKAIGIEIEEKYCEIAAKRLSQEVFDFGKGAA